MSKKHKTSGQAQPNPPISITVTLPDEGDMPRTGQILVQRGTLATLGQFSYTDLSGISRAIQDAALRLIQLEQDPPPDDVKPQADMPVQDAAETVTPDASVSDDDAETGSIDDSESSDENNAPDDDTVIYSDFPNTVGEVESDLPFRGHSATEVETPAPVTEDGSVQAALF